MVNRIRFRVSRIKVRVRFSWSTVSTGLSLGLVGLGLQSDEVIYL